jgi:L-lactate dehydrogenase complex protein LldG
MSARERMLAAIAANKPALSPLPDITFLKGDTDNLTEKFTAVLTTIGGKVITANSYEDIISYIKTNVTAGQRVISTLSNLSQLAELVDGDALPHSLQNIELAVIKAHFGVAENGAVWITEDLLNQRVLPFICQHLIIILDDQAIVPTMHEAYERIGDSTYGFGTFIAGPSKTADIEQSLVLGAHGSRSMTVFLLKG